MQAIYKIINKINGKIYIGSTNNIKKRWNNHRSKLNNNKHENNYLQQAWNKYGEEAFEFFVIEEVTDQNRIEREIYFLNETKSYERSIGYNFDKNPTDKSGKNNPFYGKKHKSETKKKLKNFAKNRSDEYKKKIFKNIKKGEEHKKSKLSWDKVSQIREKYKTGNYTYKILSEEYNVARTTIQAIIENKTWIVQDLLG